MQFIKNISALSALFAAVAVAAPVPAAQQQGNVVVLDSHGQPGVPVNNPQVVTQTQTAAPAAATVTVTHTAGQPAVTPQTPQQPKGQQPQQPQQSNPWSSQVTSQPVASQPVASIQTQPHNTGSQTQSHSSPSSTSSGSQPSGTGKSNTGATPGKLTIVNNCKKTIYFSAHQGLTDVTGGNQPIAPGKSGYSDINGASQAVWITNDQANTPYAYGDGTTGSATGNPGAAMVEWTYGGSSPSLDLSLIKGNPFVTLGLGGQTLKTPCANNHVTSGDQYTTSCNANNLAGCPGGYFDNVGANDKTFSCPNMSEGLVYTACAFA